MKRLWPGFALGVFATVAGAQEPASVGSGAVLRGLDKINGQVIDIDLANGEGADFGSLRIDLAQCRYPEGNPAGDAYAFLTIREQVGGQELFSGWMLASSPALNALEHPRYDVWVLRCKI
ncbi:hypothetical protein SAMN05443999_104150 [Roseovarius azorensis]|uniref:DUF2155 domain-containing protein n=1 Tax=Roseovarius azorensis TaxID=1287727 RepID=A0A1H7NJ19_9RHOB|nr:DUF2155 domain-containing protein [Roseovarius azorensis]SEL23319.1 hypothetical protein SAMN05443999_104150 [Roseovarius azorensis]